MHIGKHMSDKLFSADYPQYPSSKSLMVNPALPVEENFILLRTIHRQRAATKETLLLTHLMRMMIMKQMTIVTIIMILTHEMNQEI